MHRPSLGLAPARAALALCLSLALVPLGGAGLTFANDGGGGMADYQAEQLRKAPVKPRARATQPSIQQPAKPVPAAKRKPARSVKADPQASARKAPVRARASAPPRPRETAPSGLPPQGETRFVNDQVIVRYRLDAGQQAMDDLVRRLDLRHLQGRTFTLAGVTVHLYGIIGGSPVRTVISALEADPSVVSAQPNYLYSLLQAAAQRAESPQYAFDRLAVAKAHALATGTGVRIAVIDSQIDSGHPEFTHSTFDLLDVTEAAGGAHAHGTTIAGIIVSRGTLLGIAPDVTVVGIRAFLPDEKTGVASSTTWRIAEALDRSHEAGAQILNMSFAGPEDPLVARGIAGSHKRGMISIAAAGNAGPDAPPLYPAAFPGVIAVTATDKDDLIYELANRGAHIAIAAPGVDILGPVPEGGYDITSGTSLAAAHISGLAALLLSREPSLTAADVAEILYASSADLGQPGRDPVFGTGLPDALSAVSASASKLSKKN